MVSPATRGGVAFVFSLRFHRISIEPAGKLKKQADFTCFNGHYMLLWNKCLDVCVSALVLITFF